VSDGGAGAELLSELSRAYAAELGARALYGWLARIVPDAELRRLMGGLEEEEQQQIARLTALMGALDAPVPRTVWRRRAVSLLLAACTPVFGTRPVLRLCEEAEGTASRWYAHFAEHCRRSGAAEAAAACQSLSRTKAHHAQTLRTWVDNAPRR
jgi:rubrerythrin